MKYYVLERNGKIKEFGFPVKHILESIQLDSPTRLLILHGHCAVESEALKRRIEAAIHPAPKVSIQMFNEPIEANQEFVIIDNIRGQLTTDNVWSLLRDIVPTINKQVMLLVSEQGGDYAWDMLQFQDFDFNWVRMSDEKGNICLIAQFYRQVAVLPHHTPSGINAPASQRRYHLAFVLPDLELTGGMKQLVSLVKEICLLGHRVSLYVKSDSALSAIPSWSDLASEELESQSVIPITEEYLAYIPSVDAIIVGWMMQIPELLRAPCPIVLWEQGSELLFGDFGKLLSCRADERIRLLSIYQSDIYLFAVSTTIQRILRGRFGRGSELLPAGIHIQGKKQRKEHGIKTVLLVGNAGKPFKNFSFALAALRILREQGYSFSVTWASQVKPQIRPSYEPLNIDVRLLPSQEELSVLYNEADIFLSTSMYEAFSLPPLEAMAAGAAVAAVDSGGINTYAVSGENCLLSKQGDLMGLVENVKRLLEQDDFRISLAQRGRLTAEAYSAKQTAGIFESLITGILLCR